MAKGKQKEEKTIKANFVGGPRDGSTMQLVNPPPEKIRLAFPVWSTYEWDKALNAYRYIGDMRIEDRVMVT